MGNLKEQLKQAVKDALDADKRHEKEIEHLKRENERLKLLEEVENKKAKIHKHRKPRAKDEARKRKEAESNPNPSLFGLDF